MWFLGLLIGAALGSYAGFSGAMAGALLGLVFGLQWKKESDKKLASQNNSGAPGTSHEQRLRTMEAQIDWLRRDSIALHAELAKLRGDGVAPVVEAADSGVETLPEAAAAIPELTPLPVPPPPPQPPPPPPPVINAVEAQEPAWWSRLLAGNVLAKIGVVLLFFGVASGLRLAAEYGLMPVQLRLLLGAVAGVAMVLFGWSRVQKALQPQQNAQRMFGLAVQGGGFAILYLIVYFMLARYVLLGEAAAFALFALLGVVCVLLATKQNGELLAVFGIAGAFLAPVLAASGGGDPLMLFAYFALLNAFVLGVGWFHSWRMLNVAGFILTLIVGMSWAMDQYRPLYYPVAQGFLILFCVMYSAASPLTALLRAPGWKGWGEGILVFGTPLAGSFLQAALLEDDRYGLAWSALLAGLYYLALWLPLYRRPEPEIRLLERSHLGIAIALFTLAVPLAFGAQVTSALWAVEGIAVLWFGVQRERRVAQAFGAAMQLVAGVYFMDGLSELSHAHPVFNDVCLGGLLISVAGFTGAALLRRLQQPVIPAVWLLGWSLLWWFGTGWGEIEHFAPPAMHLPLLLLLGALTCAALESYGAAQSWRLARYSSQLLLPLLCLVATASVLRDGHALAGYLAIVLPCALGVYYWMLARQGQACDDMPPVLRSLQHVVAWWLIVALAGSELAWVGQHLAPGVSLWPLLAWGVAAAGGLWLADFGTRRGVWPFAEAPVAYRGFACLPLLIAATGWSLFAAFTHAGGGSGLPYLPVLNPFDLTQLAVLVAVRHWLVQMRDDPLPGWRAAGSFAAWPAVPAFVWISTLAARIAHHWGDVPFAAQALFHSALLQGMLTLLWSAVAIGLMIHAARQGRREGWYGGFALLAVVGIKLLAVDLANAGTAMWTGSLIGVALLVLAASYFAPVPPKRRRTPEAAKMLPMKLSSQKLRERIDLYEKLMRLDKPIGILLLLWPTLWGLWLSSLGQPDWGVVWIFTLGTALMRSAGCVINDFADRDFDPHVARTKERPLAARTVSVKEAMILFAVLVICAFLLILPLKNWLIVWLSVAALFLAASYPFTKRFFAVPQAYLGVAFGFGIPMAYAAQLGSVPAEAWWLLLANVFWAIAYDTEYAMVDRADDLKIGIKTSAITFGRFDVAAIMLCYALALLLIGLVGYGQHLGGFFYAGIAVAAMIAGFHYTLIKTREPAACFKAFLHNNWIGACIFAGIALGFLLQP